MMSARAFVWQCKAYLALAALTLQLTLSFAHTHRHDLAVPRIGRADSVGVAQARGGLQIAERLPARFSDDEDHCPICFTGFLLSNSSLLDAPAIGCSSPKSIVLSIRYPIRCFSSVTRHSGHARHPSPD
jgi:hypothetical protein